MLYLYGENGIIFGIVRDDDIFRKWSEFFDVPVQVGNIYQIKLYSEFKYEARVLFKGSHTECTNKFTEFNDEYTVEVKKINLYF